MIDHTVFEIDRQFFTVRQHLGDVLLTSYPLTFTTLASLPAGNVTVTDTDDTALDSMFVQAYATRKRLAQEGILLRSTELSTRLQITRQAINQRAGAGSLFTVEGLNGAIYYPAFFADEQYDKRAVRKVVRALTGLPGASKWHFFTRGAREL